MYNVEVVIPRKVTADEVLQVIQSITSCKEQPIDDSEEIYASIKHWAVDGSDITFWVSLYEEASPKVAATLPDAYEEYALALRKHFNTSDVFTVAMETPTITNDAIFMQLVLALRGAFGGIVDSGSHLLTATSEGEVVDEEQYLRIFLQMI